MIASFTVGFAACVFASSQGLYIGTKPTALLRRFISPPAFANNNFKLSYPVEATVPAAPLTIIGDSIADLGPWNRLVAVESNNFGVTGDTSEGILARLENLRVGPAVMVQFGTNDVLNGVRLKTTKANVDAILRRLEGKQIIFAIVPPTVDAKISDELALIAEYQRHACRRTKDCTIIDLPLILGRNGVLDDANTTDGTHLNFSAYRKWADHIPEVR